MSGTVTAAIAAARVAATAVQQVANVVAEQTSAVADKATDSISFSEVFQGNEPSVEAHQSAPDSKARLDELKTQFVESARKVMASVMPTLGIGPDQAVSLSIDASGRIEVSGDNSQAVRDKAAQIEAILSADGSLSQMATQILSASGNAHGTIDLPATDNLTIPLPQATIGR
ncbi:hypothetical protein LF1_24640 [Rubripirellula obstinata]|uniref:Uncharacterized protein n=1 Tax=Rubripirellula obstinata TaxID=406547 RepID=A0A5B1CH96_9BACT|nr:hypothetical protein [Rubripirellula obstinata]KAA1259926.1 hypothetical protein LF1_24640 [Rubripirellula obstinata]